MPTSFTSRKHLSETVAAVSNFGTEQGVNYTYAKVPVKGSGDIEPIGTPVVWNNATSAYEVYVAQDIAAVAGTPALPNGAPIGVTVGTYESVGTNYADVTLSSTATEMYVLFRGEAAVKDAGIEWGTATAGDQAEFKLQLEKQGIAVVSQNTLAAPAFV